MKQMRRILLGLALPVLLLLAWWWVTTYTEMSHAILPAIPEVAATFREFLLDGTLQADLGDSLSRVIKGYAVAVVLGIFTIRMLGTAMVAFGMSSQVRGVMTGVFLLVVLVYSANAGLLEQTRTKKRIAAEANAAYQKFKAAG